MGKLEKYDLGIAPSGVGGDTPRSGNTRMNRNIDVLNSCAALRSWDSGPITTPGYQLGIEHVGARVDVNLPANASDVPRIKMPAAATCPADGVLLLRNVGAGSFILDPFAGSGDTLALSRLNAGESVLVDTNGTHAWRVLILGRSFGGDELAQRSLTTQNLRLNQGMSEGDAGAVIYNNPGERNIVFRVGAPGAFKDSSINGNGVLSLPTRPTWGATPWDTENFDPNTKVSRAGDAMKGALNWISNYGENSIGPGTGDGASYETYNLKIRSWFGIGISDNEGRVNGYYDSRMGKWDCKGGFFVNGVRVWDSTNVEPLDCGRGGDVRAWIGTLGVRLNAGLASGNETLVYNDARQLNFVIRTGSSNAYQYTTVDAWGNLNVPARVTAGGGATVTVANFGYLNSSGGGVSASANSMGVSLYAPFGGVMGWQFWTTSDVRLKRDVTPISEDYAIRFVQTVHGYSFLKGKSDIRQRGFLAQEVGAAASENGVEMLNVTPDDDPDLVEMTDRDGFVSPAGAALTIDYTQIIAVHAVVLQNLLRRVSELENELAAGKNAPGKGDG